MSEDFEQRLRELWDRFSIPQPMRSSIRCAGGQPILLSVGRRDREILIDCTLDEIDQTISKHNPEDARGFFTALAYDKRINNGDYEIALETLDALTKQG